MQFFIINSAGSLIKKYSIEKNIFGSLPPSPKIGESVCFGTDGPFITKNVEHSYGNNKYSVVVTLE